MATSAASRDSLNNPMPDSDKKRRPMLTRREQAILAFLLALLVVGGIVRKVRTEGQTSSAIQLPKP
jgi:hypothetical protein